MMHLNLRTLNFRTMLRGGAVLLGALFLTWPAIYNRYPLIYPDSLTYIESGAPVANAIFLHKLSDYYGMRSMIYALGIFPFHGYITPWPIVALNAVLTAYLIWLVVRSFRPRRTALRFFALVVPLALLTGVGWFVSLVMPDILGALVYLCIYLLVFATDTLNRAEIAILVSIAAWSIASHLTHLILGLGVLVFVLLVLAVRAWPIRPRLRAAGGVLAILLAVIAAQVALNAYLNGAPSLSTDRPPFLTARIITDGPGRTYLEQNCPAANLAMCEHAHNLPDNTDDLLWSDNGIWQSASPEKQELILKQESRFVAATLLAYPRAQISASLSNFWRQLTSFSIAIGPNPWVPAEFDNALPGERSAYAQSRQVLGTLPQNFFSFAQDWTVIASLVVIVGLAPFVWKHHSAQLVGLTAVTIFAVVANAFVTGVLSDVDDRYQARVVWLLPLLAGVFLLEFIAIHPLKLPFTTRRVPSSRSACAG